MVHTLEELRHAAQSYSPGDAGRWTCHALACERAALNATPLPHRQMGLAIGVVEMTHNIGNWLGKVAVDVSEPLLSLSVVATGTRPFGSPSGSVSSAHSSSPRASGY